MVNLLFVYDKFTIKAKQKEYGVSCKLTNAPYDIYLLYNKFILNANKIWQIYDIIYNKCLLQ